jgi:hypothetical protein
MSFSFGSPPRRSQFRHIQLWAIQIAVRVGIAGDGAQARRNPRDFWVKPAIRSRGQARTAVCCVSRAAEADRFEAAHSGRQPVTPLGRDASDMPYAHDLFPSYPSPDRPWAIKLMNDLKAKRPSLKIFFDQTSLRTGDRWEPQLDAAIDNSRHLAVLWTDNASSGWVGPEFERFDAGRRRATTSERQLLFYIPLQGSRANLERFQGFAHSDHCKYTAGTRSLSRASNATRGTR